MFALDIYYYFLYINIFHCKLSVHLKTILSTVDQLSHHSQIARLSILLLQIQFMIINQNFGRSNKLADPTFYGKGLLGAVFFSSSSSSSN
jgi:hypothetical protein